ncbi:P antigen family member 4 [Diceros bicornis minor]|uniref:P antigen family member 4 n=1 Tax=Diceros bicornis minor TaxID=77932 RepID=UPI0026E9B86B|nr:P antigen family member 4 [Diceros bicornis minor]
MSARVRSRSRGRRSVRESSNPVEPVVAQQPGGKKSQQKKPPAENPDIEPGQEREEEASAVQEELEVEDDSQVLDVEKPEGKDGDGLDEKGKTPPNPSTC